MDTMYFKECIGNLKELKRDAQKMQKKGLPFMMASVVIWSLITVFSFTGKKIAVINMSAFLGSSLCNGIRSASAPVWLGL